MMARPLVTWKSAFLKNNQTRNIKAPETNIWKRNEGNSPIMERTATMKKKGIDPRARTSLASPFFQAVFAMLSFLISQVLLKKCSHPPLVFIPS